MSEREAPTYWTRTWQLQVAKARFSEVFRLAMADGPQLVTRQGSDAVVIISLEEYEQLKKRASQPKSLVQFFRESPLVGAELDLTRDPDTGREIDI
ncbi:MAG: type II toxin-antitoxin system Phd/YefM family antitoxin [Candidatus Obscuribacterales bacterium]|jgi:prevent-host-death family protein|nr:type II toxin-antitoxin system Phd/YefM family antitoxin [Candidatus Obscuribacterales bacterium]